MRMKIIPDQTRGRCGEKRCSHHHFDDFESAFAQLWTMVSDIMKVCAVYDAVPHAVPGKSLVRTPFITTNAWTRPFQIPEKKIESIILEPNRFDLMTSLLDDAFYCLSATCDGPHGPV